MAGTIKEEALKLQKNIDNVYKAGQKAEYDNFWDAHQQNGSRLQYNYTFFRWNLSKMFYPKYDIKLTSAISTFQYCRGDKFDLVKRLEECGVVLDFSESINYVSTFSDSNITHVGTLSSGGSNVFNRTFANCVYLETIDYIGVYDSGDATFNNTFLNCNSLKDVTFGGKIGRDLNLQWSPLGIGSMVNIITCLQDYSGSDSEYAYTLSFSDACWAALEASGLTAPGGTTWAEYVCSLGWVI